MLTINSRSNSCYLDLDFKYSLQPCATSLYYTASFNYGILSYRILYEKRLTLNKRNLRGTGLSTSNLQRNFMYIEYV